MCAPLNKLCGELKTKARQEKNEPTNRRALVPNAAVLDLPIVVRDSLTIWAEGRSVFETNADPSFELWLRPSKEPHYRDTGYVENQTSDREVLRIHEMPSNVETTGARALAHAYHGAACASGALPG
jgi:hypothetical protein